MTNDPNEGGQPIDDIAGGTQPSAPTAPAAPAATSGEGEGKRGRGRPTIAELEAREAELIAKEALVNERLRELQAGQIVPGRSEPVTSTVRAQDVTSEGGEPIRERKRKGGQLVSDYDIDMSLIPSGWTYEWKRVQVYGAENRQYEVLMRDQGWTPVPADRHPELVVEGHKGPIIRDGLMLMERPVELTREAQHEDRMNARAAVRAKEEQLGKAGANEFERVDAHGRPTAKINKTVERGLPVDI